MMWLRAARRFGVMSFASVVVLPPAARTKIVQGITFDVVTSSVSQAPGGGSFTMNARGMASASGGARIEVTSVDGNTGGAFTAGDYYLTVDGRSLLVHPTTKTYVDVTDMAASALKNLPPEIASQMTVTGVTGSAEKVSGDESIEGRPSQHHRTTVGYTMNVMGQSLPSTVTSDIWVAKLPVKFANPLSSGNKPPAVTGPMAELAKKQFDLMPQLNDGMVVKSVSVTTLAVMGQSIVTTITNELKNVKEGDIDASQLALPAGYTKVDK